MKLLALLLSLAGTLSAGTDLVFVAGGSVTDTATAGTYAALTTTGTAAITVNTAFQSASWNLAGYSAASNTFSAAAAETNYILIRNPTASGKTIRLDDFTVAVPDSANTVRSVVRVYMDPTTTTAGTSITVRKLKTSNATAVALVSLTPTVTTRGTLIDVYGIAYGLSSRPYNMSRYIEAGSALLVTIEPNAATTNHTFSCNWIEANP